MRVLHVIESLSHGGAEHQLALLVPALQEAGHPSVVVHLHPANPVAARLEARDVRVLNLKAPLSKREWPRLVLDLRAVIKEVRPDVVHTSLFEADLLGGLAADATRTPVVSTLCNIGGEEIRLADNPHNSRLKLAGLTTIWGWALRRRATLAISHAVKASAVETFSLDPEKVSVVYRALTEADHAPPLAPEVRREIRGALGATDDDIVFLHVGRMAPQKGQIYLLDAFREVAASQPRAVLWMVGEGWLRPTLEARGRGLGRLKFLGRREDVPQLMRAADVFVFPSLFEGLGVSLLQAAAAGMACIATNTGPLPEVITDEATGLLVPPQAAAPVAKAMLQLATDRSAIRRLGEAARVAALSRFSLDAMLQGTLEVYRRALG